MGLTGLEIFKQLPKTNCKECGQPTCLAFAMQLAAGKAGLDACPHVSDEARENLDSASAPPVAAITIGVGDKALTIGNETVLFRHDKRFEHPTGIAITVKDSASDEEIKARVAEINKLVFDRVGQTHQVDLVALINEGDAARFAAVAEMVAGATEYPLVLLSENADAMGQALTKVGDKKPLIYAATEANVEAMVELAKKYDTALAVKGASLEALAALVEKVVSLGWKKLVLDSGARQAAQVLADLTQIRRKALKERFRPFGYPAIAFACSDEMFEETLNAGVYLSKYAGIVVMNSVDPAAILPILTLRLNVYTDPQKPIAVESKIYEIGNPGPSDPVFITTNFSLSYFCVAGDVEASRHPAYVIPVDTDGTSVLTAWAAGKFSPEKITETVNELGIMEKVNHSKIIIPGHVAVLSGRLQELSGKEIIVGPRESSGIPSFLKQRWN